MGRITYLTSLGPVVALTLAACGPVEEMPPDDQAATVESAAKGEATEIDLSGVDGAEHLVLIDPNIADVHDMTFMDPPRWVIMVDCPDPDKGPECGALVAARASAWLAQQPEAATHLIINVDTPGETGSGFQLYGEVPADIPTTFDQVLDVFPYNGGSWTGKDAIARWCIDQDQDNRFCAAFVDDTCAPLVPDDVAELCRERGRS